MAQVKTISGIPYGRPARIGNYRIWWSKQNFGTKKNKVDVECINVSILDGTWLTRIPATFEMFSLLTTLYAEFVGDNEEKKRKAVGRLQTIFANMMFVSVVANGFFQQAIQSCAVAYANPSILEDSEDGFFADMKKLSKEFLEWRKKYDEWVKSQQQTKEEEHQEEIAEEAMEILGKE